MQVGLLKITTDSAQMVIVQTLPPAGEVGRGKCCHAIHLPSHPLTQPLWGKLNMFLQIIQISINDLRRIHSVRYPKEVVLKEGKEAVIRPLEKQDEGLLNQFYAELPDSDR